MSEGRRTLLGSRLVHVVVLTGFFAIAVVRTAVPMWKHILAAGSLLAWLVGQRHECAITVTPGPVDEREIRAVERESQMWFSSDEQAMRTGNRSDRSRSRS